MKLVFKSISKLVFFTLFFQLSWIIAALAETSENNSSCYSRYLPKPNASEFSAVMSSKLSNMELYKEAKSKNLYQIAEKKFLEEVISPRFTICLLISNSRLNDIEKFWAFNTHAGPLLILTDQEDFNTDNVIPKTSLERQFYGTLERIVLDKKYRGRCNGLAGKSWDTCYFNTSENRRDESNRLSKDFEQKIKYDNIREIEVINLHNDIGFGENNAGANLIRFIDMVSIRESALSAYFVDKSGKKVERLVHDPVNSTMYQRDKKRIKDFPWFPDLESVIFSKLQEFAYFGIAEQQVLLSKSFIDSSDVKTSVIKKATISSRGELIYKNMDLLTSATFFWLCEDFFPRLVSRNDVDVSFRELFPSIDTHICKTKEFKNRIVINYDDFHDIDTARVEDSLKLLNDTKLSSDLRAEILELEKLVAIGNDRLRRILKFTGEDSYANRIEQTKKELAQAKNALSQTGFSGVLKFGESLADLSSGLGSVSDGLGNIREIFLNARETKKASYVKHYWSKRKEFAKNSKTIDMGFDKAIKGWNGLQPFLDRDKRKETRDAVKRLKQELIAHRKALREFQIELTEFKKLDEQNFNAISSKVRNLKVRTKLLNQVRQQISTDLIALQIVSFYGSAQFDRRRQQCHNAVLQEFEGKNNISLKLFQSCQFGSNIKHDLRNCIIKSKNNNNITSLTSNVFEIILSTKRDIKHCLN